MGTSIADTGVQEGTTLGNTYFHVENIKQDRTRRKSAALCESHIHPTQHHVQSHWGSSSRVEFNWMIIYPIKSSV